MLPMTRPPAPARSRRPTVRPANLQIDQMDFRFFSIFAATLLVVRIALFFWPVPAPTIAGIRTHHYMYGVIAVVTGLITRSISVYAVGVGLFVDELTFLLSGGQTHQDNYSTVSLVGTLIFAVLVFFLRGILARPFGE